MGNSIWYLNKQQQCRGQFVANRPLAKVKHIFFHLAIQVQNRLYSLDVGDNLGHKEGEKAILLG
jgi:hypothetical protein